VNEAKMEHQRATGQQGQVIGYDGENVLDNLNFVDTFTT
jgi:hypothetical protein